MNHTDTASSELAIRPDQTFWSDKQKAALTQIGIDRASTPDLAVFFHQCVRTGLDPFARQIYMISRQGKQTIQTGIDGFRLIARRACDARNETLGYEETLWCGKDGVWRDVWLSEEPPSAAKVTVLRSGNRYPSVALYNEYVATDRSGEPTRMWATKGALMLAKCAEALSLRKAFPQDLSGLYTTDEMQQADNMPVINSNVLTPVTPETLDAMQNKLAEVETTQQLDQIRDELREMWKQFTFSNDQTRQVSGWLHTAGTRLASPPVEEQAEGPSVDDILDYIDNVQDHDDYETVAAAIEKTGFSEPVKQKLRDALTQKAADIGS